MSYNSTNPIAQPLALPVAEVQSINRLHRDQAGYIAEGSHGSAALEQVRANQYSAAVAEARRAIDRVLQLQEQNMENALRERPMPELAEELRALGITHTIDR